MRQVLMLTGSASLILNWLYVVYGSDSIGSVTGVFFSLFVFPFILWAVLTAGVAFVSRTRITMNVGDWGWLLISIGGAYLPVILIWIVLSSGLNSLDAGGTEGASFSTGNSIAG